LPVTAVQEKSKAGRGSADIVSDGYAHAGRRRIESARNAVPRRQSASVVLRRCWNQACLRIRVGGIGTNLGLHFGRAGAPTAVRTEELKAREQQGSASGDSVAHRLRVYPQRERLSGWRWFIPWTAGLLSAWTAAWITCERLVAAWLPLESAGSVLCGKQQVGPNARPP
jgi:hypothetical protein